MALHLRIQQVRTTSQLRSAANASELEERGYTVEGEYVVVDNQTEADELLSTYSNLELELDRGNASAADREADRMELTTEGARESGTDGDEVTVETSEICGTEMSDGSVCERPPDECPYH